jgi:hypothetical protein
VNVHDDAVLQAFRDAPACEWCKQPSRGYLEPNHYWVRKGMGGGSQLDHPWNLIAMCLICHQRFHAGHITRWCCLAIVAAREGVLQGEIEAELTRLRRCVPRWERRLW